MALEIQIVDKFDVFEGSVTGYIGGIRSKDIKLDTILLTEDVT
jgi:hypothetical protein